MSPTRTSNPDLADLQLSDDSARAVPEAERKARLQDRLNEAELELLIQASALRLQGLVLARSSSEDEAEIA